MRFIVLFILCVMLAAGCSTQPALPEGVSAVTPTAIPDYALTNQAGEEFHLNSLQGQYVLVSFGYTHCPDICPINLGRYTQIKNELGDQAANMSFVFISVDPQRDTPERLRDYLVMFDISFIGVYTGDEATAQQVIGSFGGTFNIRDYAGLRENYTVDHTASNFLLGPDGNWIRTYAYGTATSIISADIAALMAS
ncbi:MAG: SCO family protein [Anaerolineae bacterium]